MGRMQNREGLVDKSRYDRAFAGDFAVFSILSCFGQPKVGMSMIAGRFGGHLGDFGRHFDPSGSRKESKNHTFSQETNIKYRKIGSRTVSEKNMIWGCIFDDKMEGLECLKPSWRSILVTIYKVSVFREKA